MNNTMENLEGLSSNQWSGLFSEMENIAKKEVSARKKNLLYRYLGEIDCPEEMFQDFATVEDVRKTGGKTNWFICSDGSFYTCGDCQVDYLLENGKCVDYDFSFEEERNEKYCRMTKEEKISFRVKLQGLTDTEAKEIVCDELGISAYDYTFTFEVSEELFNSDTKEKETKAYTEYIEADSAKEAEEKLDIQSRKIGSIIQSGKRFTEEDNRKMRESGLFFGYKGGTEYYIRLVNRNIKLINQKSNIA